MHTAAETYLLRKYEQFRQKKEEAAVARRQAAAQQARQSLASKLPPSLALALGTGSGALPLPLRGSRAAPGSRSAGVEKESATPRAATDIAAEGTVAATLADAPPPGETAKDRALRALRTQRQMTETGEGGDHARGAAGAGVHAATSITGRKLPSAARRNMHGAGPPPTPLHAPVAAEPEPAPVGYVPINRQRGTGGNDGGGEGTASASSGFANARSAAAGITAPHAAPQAYKPAGPVGFKPPLPGGFRPPVPSGFKPPNPAGVRPPIPAGFRHLGPAGFRPPAPAGFKVATPGAGSSGASGGAGATLIGNKRSTPEPSPAPSAPSYGSDDEDGYAGSALHSHCCTTSAAGAAFTVYGGGLLSCAMNCTCQAFPKLPDRTVCTENGASSRLSHLGSRVRRNGSCGGGSYSSTDFGNRFMLNRLDVTGVSVSNGSRSDGDADDEASGDEHGNSCDTSGRIRRTSCGKDRGTSTWFIPQFDGADDIMHDDTGGDGPDIGMATTAAAPAATAGLALPLIHSDPVVATAAALGALSGLPLGTDGLAVLAGGDGVAAGMPACEPLLVSAVPAVSPEEAQSALAEATAALVQATAALAEATAALAEATSASPVPMPMPCVTEANGMQILADPNAMPRCLPDPSATPFMTAVDGTAVWGVMPFAAPYAPLALDGGAAAFVALGASDPAVASGSVIDANAAGTACANIHIGALGPGSFDSILPPLHQLQALQPMDTSTATTDFISAPAVSLEPFLGDPACAILHTGTAAAAAVGAGALADSSMGILPATAAVAVGGGAVASSLAADAGSAADMDLIAIAALGDGPELEEAAVLTFEDDDDDVLDASFHAFIQSDDDIGEGDFGCPVVIGLVPAGPAVPGTILPQQQQCQQQQQQQQQQRQQQHLVQQQLPAVQEHQELHQQQGSAQKEWGIRQQQQPQASVSMGSSRPGCSLEQTHATVVCTEGHVLQQREREQQRQQRDRSHQRGGQRRLMEPTTEPRTIKLEPTAEDEASQLPPPPPLPRQEHTQTQRGQQQRQRKEEPSFLKQQTQQMQQGRIYDSVSLNLHHFSGPTSKAPPPPPTPWVGEPSSQRARQAGADAKGADVEDGCSGKAGAQSVGGNTAGVVAVARIKISGPHATMASQPPLPPPPSGAMHNLRGSAIVSPSQSLPTLPRPRPPLSLPGPQLRNPAGGLGETPHGGSGSSPTRGRPIRAGLSSNSPCASSGEGASGSTSGTASSESDLDCRSRSRSRSPSMSPFRRRGARGGMPSPRRRSSRSRSRSPPYHLRRRNSRSRGSRSPARGRGSGCGRVTRSPSRSRSRSRSWSPRAGSRRRGSGRSPPPIGGPYRNGGGVGGGGCADAGRRGGRKRRRRQRGGRRRGGQGYAQPSAAVGMLAGAAPPPPPPSAGPGGSMDGGGGGSSVAGPAARPLPLPPPPPLPSESRDRCNRGSGGGGGGGGGGGTVATASAGVGVPQLREGDRRQDRDRDGTRERTDPRDRERERERERSEAHEWDHRGGPRGGFGGSVSVSGGGGDRRSQELACTLFVGDLPHGITAGELRGVFAAYSKEVVNARLVSGQLYGFVRFSSPEAATAVLELSRNMGVEAGGHRLTVARAQGSLPDWKKTGPSQQRREYSVSDGYGVPYDLPPIAIAPGPMRMPMRQPPMFGMFGMGSPVPSGHRVTRHVLEYDDL